MNGHTSTKHHFGHERTQGDGHEYCSVWSKYKSRKVEFAKGNSPLMTFGPINPIWIYVVMKNQGKML